MFVDFQDELIRVLNSHLAEGKHLEGIDLVQFSDAPIPHHFPNAIAVDWDNKIDIQVLSTGVNFVTNFSVGLVVSHTLGEKEADRKLQDYLMRWDPALGKWRGLIPALVFKGLRSDESGKGYFVKILPQTVRGTMTEKKIFKAGCYLSLEVTLKALPQEFRL